MESTVDCGPTARELLTRLGSPVRNRYYYGKLLDAYHLELEQSYGIRKRWLLNRLSLGCGVLCGLDVVASSDGTQVRVRGGVAIDCWGREIIVPNDSPPVDPRQPTDDCGRPAGEPVRDGTVTIWVCYHECEAEPSPVLVSECPERECENGLVRERYRVRVSAGQPAPPSIPCDAVFATPPAGETRRTVLCDALDHACPAPDESCVALATVEIDRDRRVRRVDNCAVRRMVYSNTMLLELILCLAARVDECCGPVVVRRIEIASGDNQTGPVNQPLPQPLVARVMEGGSPRANEPVTFDVATGGGSIGAPPAPLGATFTVNTAADGTATLPTWRLGPAAGDQRVTARIATGSPAIVTFHATGERVETTMPVVRTIWPPTADVLSPRRDDAAGRRWFREFMERPRIELTFNKKMDAADLAAPDAWLRVFLVRTRGQEEQVVEVSRIAVVHAGPPATPMLPEPGAFCEAYNLRVADDVLGARVVTLIRAEATNILDADSPSRLLDADFHGTTLTPARLEELWKVTNPQLLPHDVWDALVNTGATLPQSGNGTDGGRFESWFEVQRD